MPYGEAMLANVQESAESRFHAVFGARRAVGVVEPSPEVPAPPPERKTVDFLKCNRRLHFEKRSGEWQDDGMPLLWLTTGPDSAIVSFESTARSWKEHPEETLLFLA